ncbi:hypothetical protein V6N13_004875 [Hibiscus sabdariffa]
MPSTVTYGAHSIRPLPPPLTNQQQQPACNLKFSNNRSFWNPSATSTDVKPDFLLPLFEEKPSFPNKTTKTNIVGVQKTTQNGW